MPSELFQLKLAGFEELERALRELPNSTAKAQLRTALKKAAQPIADRAANLAPRRTGRLASHIEVKTTLSKRQRRRRQKAGTVEAFIGAIARRAPHAHLVEFGTIHMPAQPFLRPAWDSGKKGVLESMRKQLAKGIEKARRRLIRKAARAAAA